MLGLAATYTLASWTDSEWVWGGSGTTPGVGTSTFEVEQNVASPFDNLPANWANRETNPGGGLTFTTGAIALSPGTTVFAPVALRTTDLSVAGTVTLNAATPATGIAVADASNLLWNAIDVQVYTKKSSTSPFAPIAPCSAATPTDTTNWTAIGGITDLTTAASDTQVVDAASASVQHYCFALTLPAGSPDTLQGRTIAPAWEFTSVSN